MSKIFLSYRRDDSADITGRIYDRLEAHFGAENIFRDVDAIPFGLNFRKVIDDAVGKCQIALAVIGPDWVAIQDGKGRKRLTIPNDFVRLEMEAALRRDIPVIPVLVGGADMPSSDDLPETLGELAYRNGIEVRRDPDFKNDIERLIRGITKLLEQMGAKVVSPPPPPPPPTKTSSGVDADAEYRKGLEHYTVNNEEAAKCFRKAAEQGHAEAQNYLGWLYHNGWGVKQDYIEAIYWYKKAAAQGHAIAHYNVGSAYHNGWGVKLDYEEAMKWYKVAADKGYSNAIYNIGWLYHYGKGVAVDYDEAMRWYKKAAEQNNPVAQNNIGSLYAEGKGVAKDNAKAIEWFRKAANQGNATAKEWLKKLEG